VPNIIKTTHCLAAISIKDHLIKLTMWWQGAQKLRNDRPGGAAAPLLPRQFRHCARGQKFQQGGKQQSSLNVYIF